MDKFNIISWIFLSIAYGSQKEPIDYRGISQIADGINHAIPNQKELQLSVKWLLTTGLITNVSKRFELTKFGSSIMETASANEKTSMGLWKRLAKEFSGI